MSQVAETSRSVLVLSATYQPLNIVSGRRAVKYILTGKAIALDGSGHFLTSADGQIEIPYVVLLKRAVIQKPNTRSKPKFSRRGVMIRDNNTCAYCGKYAETIDHVNPRALGGKSTYDNCVAACLTCNRKKADRTLAQLGWTISYKLKSPSPIATKLDKAHHYGAAFEIWKPYILSFEPQLEQRWEADALRA